MELAANQAELFPVFASAPAKTRSRVRQYIDATLEHGPLLTPAYVAEALGLTKQRVHVLLNENRIPVLSIAGERFVPCAALDLFMTEKREVGKRRLSFGRMLQEADRVAENLIK